MTSASRKPASTSPLRIFQREMTLPVGSSRGASGRIADLGVEDAGQVLVLDGHPARALLGRLLGLGGHERDGLPEEAHDLVREHLRPRPERPHRRRLAGHVAEEDVVRDVPGGEDRSEPRARASAALVSIRTIRADGRGERTTFAWSMPPIAKSSA